MTVDPTPLLEPREGLPEVVDNAHALEQTITALTAGQGPVAVDAERASGYRYSHRAYLVQLRRAGAGTALIDPIACPDLTPVGVALADTEWVLHAASQDLPCLAEVGMRSTHLFDTELAGRLLNFPKVGLGPLTEIVLGYTLEKGHSAVDWSTRPLPEDWLRYAALDVELLVELRDALEEQLRDAGKLDWALEEFGWLATVPTPAERTDPWRRTSGLHRVRTRRQLAAIRELWTERDQLAHLRDVSPRRVLPDAAIVEAAMAMPAAHADLIAMPVFRGRAQRRDAARWFAALARARALREADLPPLAARYDGPPPARSWPSRDAAAAARLAGARVAVGAIADSHELPVENLLAPDSLRRISWSPPEPGTEAAVAAALRQLGARDWQIALAATAIAEAFAAADQADAQ